MSLKIMVVDDNQATRRMVRNALVRNGHAVLEAPDGATARELMRREHPRIVIQDLMLPDADGFELVGELRELAEGTEVSILAFSGFASELEEARISSVGFDDIIAKPIAPSQLVPLVEAHLPPPTTGATGTFGSGRRIVLADDDPMQLKLMSFRLARLGFQVEAVTNGAEALASIRRVLPDAIVSDVMMPELDGFGLAIAVRQDPSLQQLPVVLVTSSYVEPGDRELARRAGATDLVARTPELAELLDALRTSMSRESAQTVPPEVVPALEREHNQRVLRQLERQVMLNHGLARRCSVLASELTVLTGISEAVLKHRDLDSALDEALVECFDAGGISTGALYLIEGPGMRVRTIGDDADAGLADFYGHPELLQRMFADARPLKVPSKTVPAELEHALLGPARATALLVVPLTYRDEVHGALLMVARGNELDHDDWDMFALGVATQISHVLALARSYREREAAERRATEHAALLDAVLESAPDTVLHIALDGTIRFANRVAAPFAAPGDATLVGRDVFALPSLAGEFATTFRTVFERLIASGDPEGFEAPTLSADGSTHWYSTRLGPIKQAGRIAGVVAVSRDVSENKQTELHLMIADRMASVGTLAAGVAHEINNPLASVIANLEMAAADVEDLGGRVELPPELKDEIADARTASDRVREIVRDLKIFSRTEEDRRGAVDVERVLESTLRMAWNELRHRARLVKDFGGVPHVEANESRLGQVFLNLIINAAQAIPAGNYDANEIRVATSVDGHGRIVVTIADTGGGIPLHVRPRLFTPFFTTKPVGVGTGLGLAISHRIITQFGGSITFDSETGKGTEFHVILPPSTAVSSRAASTVPPKTVARRRGTVLVIDDERALTQTIQRFLGTDHDVTIANRGAEALAMFEAGKRFDVILCDIMMPQVTGMELFETLVAVDADQAARIIFLTGGAFTPGARDFLDNVRNRRLEKPFDLAQLRKLVDDAIR